MWATWKIISLGVNAVIKNFLTYIVAWSQRESHFGRPDLPDSIPIVRLVSEGKTGQMTEYVTLAVLLFQRRLLEYRTLQRSSDGNIYQHQMRSPLQ